MECPWTECCTPKMSSVLPSTRMGVTPPTDPHEVPHKNGGTAPPPASMEPELTAQEEMEDLFESFTSNDAEVLQSNLGLFFQSPSIRKMLKRFGITLTPGRKTKLSAKVMEFLQDTVGMLTEPEDKEEEKDREYAEYFQLVEDTWSGLHSALQQEPILHLHADWLKKIFKLNLKTKCKNRQLGKIRRDTSVYALRKLAWELGTLDGLKIDDPETLKPKVGGTEAGVAHSTGLGSTSRTSSAAMRSEGSGEDLLLLRRPAPQCPRDLDHPARPYSPPDTQDVRGNRRTGIRGKAVVPGRVVLLHPRDPPDLSGRWTKPWWAS